MAAPKHNKTHRKVQLIKLNDSSKIQQNTQKSTTNKEDWVHCCTKCSFITYDSKLKSAAHCGQLKDPTILICRLLFYMSGTYELIWPGDEFFHKFFFLSQFLSFFFSYGIFLFKIFVCFYRVHFFFGRTKKRTLCIGYSASN